jgi:hypothetical protein
MRLLIKYASRGRPDMFKDAITNIMSTIWTSKFRIIVSADLDDQTMNNDEIRKFVAYYYPKISIFYDEPVSKVDAINRDMPPVYDFDWLVNTSDDMQFSTIRWDELMVKSIKSVWGESLDFFAHFNDGFVADKLPTMAIMGVDFFKRFYYIYHDSYKSVSCDAEQYWVAQMLGRYHYFPDIYFHHLHPANIRIPTDHVYLRNDKYDKEDTANYFSRMRKLFNVENPVNIPTQLLAEIKHLK